MLFCQEFEGNLDFLITVACNIVTLATKLSLLGWESKEICASVNNMFLYFKNASPYSAACPVEPTKPIGLLAYASTQHNIQEGSSDRKNVLSQTIISFIL